MAIATQTVKNKSKLTTQVKNINKRNRQLSVIKGIEQNCMRISDYIDLCFEKIQGDETKGSKPKVYMYFLKNDQIVFGENESSSDWKRGRFELDLTNYYYYFGFASKACIYCNPFKPTEKCGSYRFEISVV